MFRIYVIVEDEALSMGILVDTERDAKDLCDMFNTIEQDSGKEYTYKEVD